MTREVKIGMAVAGSFLSLVGIVVGTKLYNSDIPQPINGIVADASDVKGPEPIKKPATEGEPNVLQAHALNAKPLPGQTRDEFA